MKGRIKDIEPTENKIRFDVELDIAITDWEAEDYDFTLVGTSDNGNSIISFGWTSILAPMMILILQMLLYLSK